jgi:hypothetical protein
VTELHVIFDYKKRKDIVFQFATVIFTHYMTTLIKAAAVDLIVAILAMGHTVSHEGVLQKNGPKNINFGSPSKR